MMYLSDIYYNNGSSAEPSKEENREVDIDIATDDIEPYQLIIWNDEVNTFEWVIQTLIEVCGQSPEQAEQCAWLIHNKGKYAVKKGDYDFLKPMRDEITDRGIDATIESLVDC